MRTVEAGNAATCVWCCDPIKFSARERTSQVIANVYVDGRWNRVEHYHSDCYQEAGEPYRLTA